MVNVGRNTTPAEATATGFVSRPESPASDVSALMSRKCVGVSCHAPDDTGNETGADVIDPSAGASGQVVVSFGTVTRAYPPVESSSTPPFAGSPTNRATSCADAGVA